MKYGQIGPEFPISDESSLPELYRAYRALNKSQSSIWLECEAFQEWLEVFFMLFEDTTTILYVVQGEF